MAETTTLQIICLIGNYMTTGNEHTRKARITNMPCIAKTETADGDVETTSTTGAISNNRRILGVSTSLSPITNGGAVCTSTKMGKCDDIARAPWPLLPNQTASHPIIGKFLCFLNEIKSKEKNNFYIK
jgi:hypothetical protein